MDAQLRGQLERLTQLTEEQKVNYSVQLFVYLPYLLTPVSLIYLFYDNFILLKHDMWRYSFYKCRDYSLGFLNEFICNGFWNIAWFIEEAIYT